MPQRKSPPSLYAACLLAVAKNMDYWCSNYVKNFSGQKVLYTIGPFDCLHQGIFHDLFTVLKEEKLLRRPYLDLLLHPGVTNLSLSHNPPDLSYTLGLVGRTCRNVRNLDLSYCDKISNNALSDLARLIPHVVSLNLCSTRCNDANLKRFGKYCRELKELDVSWCDITDCGIISLCINMDDFPETSTSHCHKLASFAALGTSVTEVGALCAIKHLTNLKCLSITNTCLALHLLHREDLENGTLSSLKPYQLTSLNSDSNTVISYECIKIATVLCPNLTKFSAAEANIDSESLFQLSGFNNLQELDLGNGTQSYVTFSESIFPLLAVIGFRLKALSLAEVPGVDVCAIGCCCTNLQILNLLFTSEYETLIYDSSDVKVACVEHPFQQLCSLRVVCTETSDIPPYQIRQLLSYCCDVETIYIQCCENLTDSLLSDILNCNRMSKLRILELECCDTVTVASLESLISFDNPLEELKMLQCDSITRRDYDYLQELVRNENLKFKIEWT